MSLLCFSILLPVPSNLPMLPYITLAPLMVIFPNDGELTLKNVLLLQDGMASFLLAEAWHGYLCMAAVSFQIAFPEGSFTWIQEAQFAKMAVGDLIIMIDWRHLSFASRNAPLPANATESPTGWPVWLKIFGLINQGGLVRCKSSRISPEYPNRSCLHTNSTQTHLLNCLSLWGGESTT